MINKILYPLLFFVFATNLCTAQKAHILPTHSAEFKSLVNTQVKDLLSIAYGKNDTIALKRLIIFLKDQRYKKKDWSKVLLKIHTHINIQKNKTLDYENLIEYFDNIDIIKVRAAKIFQTVKFNHEVISLMGDGLIYYSSKENSFKLWQKNINLDILNLIERSNHAKVADVGSGIGTTGILMSLIYPETEIFNIEIDTFKLNYNKSRIKFYSTIINANSFHFIEGSTDSILIKPNKDFKYIILKNTLHHLENKNQILNSIQKLLLNEGELIVYESLPNRKLKDRQCPKIMKKRKIIKVLKKARFDIRDKYLVGKHLFLICATP